MLKHCIALMTATLLIMASAQAHEFKIGDILIGHPYAYPTVPEQTTGAAYFSLTNNGKLDDKLIHVSSSVANSVEMHSMEMVGDIMKMREVEQIVLKAGDKLSLKQGGGYHLMLLGLHKPIQAGDHFPVTLEFAKAGKIEVMVHVEATSIPAH